jgi:hypothetical protein
VTELHQSRTHECRHKKQQTNSEKLSELKVRVFGNTALTTYKDTYDMRPKGEHRAHTVIATALSSR